ncbi:hypothetical protein RIF29_18754 [Crotalaria pallida]|uniref:CASP-like protein n=1 Tax=Crotalaria pallida TaxID=3830 RepID=A0AAN9EYB1_CROPI
MKRDSKDDDYKEGDSSRSITAFNNSPATPPFTRTHIPPSPTLHSLRSNDNFQSCATKNQEQPAQHIHSCASDGIGVSPVVEATRPPVKLKTITVLGPEEVEEGDDDGSNYFLKNKKEGKLSMALLGLRIATFVFCMISFSVLAADKQGVKIRQNNKVSESFNWFKEFRYSLSINVIGFLYSGLQICDLVKYLITEKHTMNPVLRGYFDFAMDQILTYLLMSASTSAATKAYNSESVWGAYKFLIMASASVVFSYIAFVAFALTSLVSGYIICKLKLLNPNHSIYSNTTPYGSKSTHPVRNK